MSRTAFFLILFWLIYWKSLAQPCSATVSGMVMNDAGEPLPQAGITLENTRFHTISDIQGSFAFKDLCPGEYELTVTFIGYETARMRISIPTEKRLVIQLQPASTLLEDVIIEGRQGGHGASQTVTVLEESELEALHGKPLGESLKEIPGVNALQTGPAIFKPVIHGLHSQRILILNNGIRQEGQQWGVEHAPEVDPFIASQIQVVRGAETVRYGSAAMGGVILINPPPLHQTEKIGGEVNMGIMSNNRLGVFSGLFEGTLLKSSGWSWRLQSSVKRGGDYHAPKYNLSNTGLSEFNFSGALGFKGKGRGLEVYLSSFNTEIGILRAAHTGNLSDLQKSIESRKPWFEESFTYRINSPRQKISHHLMKVSAHQQVKGLGKVTFLYGGQYDFRSEYDIRRSGRSARPSLSLDLLSHVLDVSLDHEHAAHSGSIGINGSIKFNSNDTEETGLRPLLPDFRQMSAGVFLLEKWKKRKWVLEAGARYDYQHLQVLTFLSNQQLIKPNFNFNFFSGTLGATILFNEHFRLLSNFGISSRPPHVSELYSEGLHHGTASIEEGLMRSGGTVHTEQSRVHSELSRKWISTLQYTDEALSADISVYYNAIDDYVYIRPTGTRLTVRGYFPVFTYVQTDAVLAGTDLAVKWKASEKFTFNSKFSYIYAQDRRNNDVLIYIPPAQFENGVTFSLPSFGKFESVFAGVSIPVTFRQTRAPIVISPVDVGSEAPEKTFDFAPAPSGYALLNARVGFKLPVNEHAIAVSLSGENLFNTSYRNYMNRLRYYADDTGVNFILRVSYNFLSH